MQLVPRQFENRSRRQTTTHRRNSLAFARARSSHSLGHPLAPGHQGKDIRIAHVYSRTGPLEAYGKQTQTGLMMGLEYATSGTMTIDGRKIVVIEKDDQGKPDLGKALLAQAYGDDKVDLAVGHDVVRRGAGDAAGGRGVQEGPAGRARRWPTRSPATSGTATSSAPAATARRTRSQRRRARQAGTSDRDAGAGLRVRARRREGVQGRRSRRPRSSTKNTRRSHHRLHAPAQRLFDELKDKPGRKIIGVIWAGRAPASSSTDLNLEALQHRGRAGGNILPAMAA